MSFWKLNCLAKSKWLGEAATSVRAYILWSSGLFNLWYCLLTPALALNSSLLAAVPTWKSPLPSLYCYFFLTLKWQRETRLVLMYHSVVFRKTGGKPKWKLLLFYLPTQASYSVWLDCLGLVSVQWKETVWGFWNQSYSIKMWSK